MADEKSTDSQKPLPYFLPCLTVLSQAFCFLEGFQSRFRGTAKIPIGTPGAAEKSVAFQQNLQSFDRWAFATLLQHRKKISRHFYPCAAVQYDHRMTTRFAQNVTTAKEIGTV